MTRYEQLFELLAYARDNDRNVTLTIHDVPLQQAAQLVADGALDELAPGAPGNPLTGRLTRDDSQPRVEGVVFTDSHRTPR